MKKIFLSLLTAFCSLAASADEATTLLTPPDGLTTTPYRMEAFECSIGKNLDYKVQLGFAGNDVWVQGISEEFPDSWVKGEMIGTRVYFDCDQYLGIYNLNGTYFNIWLTGINHDLARFEEVQFDYNPKTGIFTQIDGNWMVFNGSLEEWKWLNNLSDVMLSPITDEEELVDHYALVTPPDGLQTTVFTVTGHDYTFGSADDLTPYEVQMGYASAGEGKTAVYVCGLFAEMPEAWVKGLVQQTEEGEVLTIASRQYLGKWFESIDCWLMCVGADEEVTDLTFVYDADRGAYVQQGAALVYFNDSYAEPSPMALLMVGDLALTGLRPDGISATAAASPFATDCYNLAGQRTGASSRGLYITAGRKMIR